MLVGGGVVYHLRDLCYMPAGFMLYTLTQWAHDVGMTSNIRWNVVTTS